MTVATLLVASLVAANPYLVEGKEHFSHLQYTEALRPLTLAVAVPGQTTAERREAYDLLARTRAALGDLAGTSEAYGELLAKDPNAPAPTDAAPKIREAFRAAKTSLFAPGVVKLTRVTAGEGHLAFELTDPWAAVTRLEVHEIAGNSRNITVTVSERERQAGLFDVKVPATLVQAWVEAFNGENTVVATLGSLRVPLRLAKSHAPSPTPPTKRDEPASSGPTTEPPRRRAARHPAAQKPTVALAPPTPLPPPFVEDPTRGDLQGRSRSSARGSPLFPGLCGAARPHHAGRAAQRQPGDRHQPTRRLRAGRQAATRSRGGERGIHGRHHLRRVDGVVASARALFVWRSGRDDSTEPMLVALCW